MTSTVIIVFCLLILVSYFFDVSGKSTRIPGVILLMGLGIGLRQAALFFHLNIPDLSPLLPLMGTIGLILIVLEGSLDLELSREKIGVISRSFISAILLLIITSVGIAFFLSYYYRQSFFLGLINAIPLGIISSAIAIPTVHSVERKRKEFVVYESSLSDILGIVMFNFFVLNLTYGVDTISKYILSIVITLIVSILSGVLLGYMLQRINHHIKFIPILAILILFYTFAKKFHLPSLLMVMLFGMMLNNINLIPRLGSRRLSRILNPEAISRELIPFEHLVGELTFMIRSFFFIMFGYYTNVRDLIEPEGLAIAGGIIAFILITRAPVLWMLKMPQNPLLFIAPRGLITILLFLSIPPSRKIWQVDSGLLSQVIFISALLMMVGMMRYSDKKHNSSSDQESGISDEGDDPESDVHLIRTIQNGADEEKE